MGKKRDDSSSLRIMQRICQGAANKIWTPGDFIDLDNREAIKKALQRLVANNQLRRIDRGLYDQVRINPLTKKIAAPDYHTVIDAVGRRDQVRILIDGLTAANDLGLTNAVPGKVIIHTDAKLRPIHLENLTLHFKLTAPSKLYWADRPAMRVVQSLYWFGDSLKTGSLVDEHVIQFKILHLLQDPNQGTVIQDDLARGLHTMPSWMQEWIKKLLLQIKHNKLKE